MTTNVKSKLFKAEKTQWVIPCNPAYYDVCGVFNKLDKVEWKQSTNVNEGDIVYIYVTSPIKEIRYKCVARKVDLDYADTEKVYIGKSKTKWSKISSRSKQSVRRTG